MNEEKSSADIYWEKVSYMIEEAESKGKQALRMMPNPCCQI